MVQMGLGTLENKIGVPGFLEKKLFFGKFFQNFWFCLGFWKIRQLATFSDLAGKHLMRSVLVSAPHRGVLDLITPKNKWDMTIFLQTIPQSHISMYFGHFGLPTAYFGVLRGPKPLKMTIRPRAMHWDFQMNKFPTSPIAKFSWKLQKLGKN